MIPASAINQWAVGAPWPSRTQVEQDLLPSRLICEITNDDCLGASFPCALRNLGRRTATSSSCERLRRELRGLLSEDVGGDLGATRAQRPVPAIGQVALR